MKALWVCSLLSFMMLSGCIAPDPKPNDPYYSPVLPRTPMPSNQAGAIYQSGFEASLYDDRRARRIGDMITITLNESTRASKNADSKLKKDSTASMGISSLLGGMKSLAGGLSKGSTSLGVDYTGSRETDGSGQAGERDTLTGSL